MLLRNREVVFNETSLIILPTIVLPILQVDFRQNNGCQNDIFLPVNFLTLVCRCSVMKDTSVSVIFAKCMA